MKFKKSKLIVIGFLFLSIFISIITGIFISQNIFNLNSKASAIEDYSIYQQFDSVSKYSTYKGVIYHYGKPIQFHGANWFGFENKNIHIIDGLWARGYKDMIAQMKTIGINALRIPYCTDTLKNVSTGGYIDPIKNADLIGLKSLDAMDKILGELNNQHMYFILDNHNPDCNGQSDLWYTAQYSETQWINDLKFLAKRYSNLEYFAGLDLKNEPKGTATWGTGQSTDWNKAAERAGSEVLSVNNNLLIFIEGIGENPLCSTSGFGHFWGENLESFDCTPISNTIIPYNKLILSPHIYGPDVANQDYFKSSSFPANMPNIWDKQFGYLSNKNMTLVPGEWGGKDGNGGLASDAVWHTAITKYYSSKGICNSFYWSWNPNSGDTGGILKDDWTQVWDNKLNLLNSYWNNCNQNIYTPSEGAITILPTNTPTLKPPTTPIPTSTPKILATPTPTQIPVSTITPVPTVINTTSINLTNEPTLTPQLVSNSNSNTVVVPPIESSNITNQTIGTNTPIITGSNPDISNIVIDTGEKSKVIPDQNGNWTFSVSQPLNNGIHTATIYNSQQNQIQKTKFTINSTLPNTGILDNPLILGVSGIYMIFVSIILGYILKIKQKYIS